MKKKLIAITAALTLTLAMGTVSFAAARPTARAAKTAYSYRCMYVDANGDGICDNGDIHCTGYVDADGDGICDNCANKQSHNGICYSNGAYHSYHAGHIANGTGTYKTHSSRHIGGRHH